MVEHPRPIRPRMAHEYNLERLYLERKLGLPRWEMTRAVGVPTYFEPEPDTELNIARRRAVLEEIAVYGAGRQRTTRAA